MIALCSDCGAVERHGLVLLTFSATVAAGTRMQRVVSWRLCGECFATRERKEARE